MTGRHAPRRADWTEYYTCRNPQHYDVDWRAFYGDADRLVDRMRADWPHDADVPYGDSPYQLGNVYRSGHHTAGPVLAFLHGGRFREGHPRYYDFLGRPWLERGVVFVSLGYRLEAECGYPDSAEDVRLALGWLYRNAGRYGADPERIFVSGHSSGGTLAAMAAVTSGWHAGYGVPPDVVKGAALLSGIYDFRGGLRPLASGSPEVASPLCSIAHVPGRMVITYGTAEYNRRGEDPEVFARQAEPFVRAVREAGAHVDDLPLDGADHIQTARSLADPAGPVFRAVARMLGVPE